MQHSPAADTPSQSATMLERFIDVFHRGIAGEMDAMRKRTEAFEIPIANGRSVDSGRRSAKLYTFTILKPDDRLLLNAECILMHNGVEGPVTIIDLDGEDVTISSEAEIELGAGSYALVIYPWFLYEKLDAAVASLSTGDFHTANALMLFGRGEPRMEPAEFRNAHKGLNASQERAIRLCCESNLAFVWGPPGTGKTTTLGHIVTELTARGLRVLITSNTNAAVDQALAKLAELEDAQSLFAEGKIVRVGQLGAESHGAGLHEVVRKVHANVQRKLDGLRGRLPEAREEIALCDAILKRLETNRGETQFDLFREVKPVLVIAGDLAPLFPAPRAGTIARLPAEEQYELIVRHRRRLERVAELCHEKIVAMMAELRNREQSVIANARVVLATMANMYVGRLLAGERFDVVIVEEAGMAVLPALFYCAALAREKVIMVGDPKQLPPIVSSKEEQVHRAIGRNIFEIAAPDPHASPVVVMLDTQYRMHPVIGDLVSTMFYDGRLLNGGDERRRDDIAARRPFPGQPLVVIDTQRRTVCATRDGGYSRFNERTARLCVDLAIEAVRDGVASIAIIAPYVEQSRLIRGLLAAYRAEAERIECRTVHRFQGGERDMVILDMVDAAPLSPGVLLAGSSARSSSRNLLNVSISRARGKLVIISDVDYFRTQAPNSVVNEILSRGIRDGMRVEME